VKTRRAVIAAGMVAGVAALPLSASADSTSAPTGSATASTVSLTVSLAPIANVVNPTGVLGQLSAAFDQLKSALCPTSPVGCDLELPTSLPQSLTVHIAQANANAVFNTLATDVASGHSDASPVTTDWTVLNADLTALETELTNLIQGSATSLATNGVAGLTSFLTSNGPGKLTLSTPLGTADLHILGTVAANLNQSGVSNQTSDSANAVRIDLSGSSLPAAVQGSLVSVDPFHAYAMNAATPATADGVAGPQVSAANTSVGVKLPALAINGASAANLGALATELKSLVNALTNAIANPTQAGSILSSVQGLPPALQGTLSTIGGLVNQTLGGAAGTVSGVVGSAPVSAPIDLTALKAWDANLSAALDGLNALINAVAGLDLPDVSNLVTSTANIATTKTSPRAAGGVTSTATSTLGAINVLPIGGTLAGLLQVLPTGSPITATTPLLSIDGITSTATAEVGPGTSSPVGSGGIQGLSILGQHIDLGGTLGLSPGKQVTEQVGIPGLGANGGTGYLTVLISEGVPQVVADTAAYRAVNMAELDVQLINGCGGACSSSALTLPISALANVAAPRAATTGSGTGVAALGNDGNLVRAAVADVTAAASMNGSTPPGCNGPGSGPSCPVQGNVVGLPKTGMLGGAAIPAALLLIAVAISLRLVPGLRTRVRRVR